MTTVTAAVQKDASNDFLKKLFGVEYFLPSEGSVVIEASEDDLYYYKVYVGSHTIEVEKGDCLYYISADKEIAHLARGPVTVTSEHVATMIRGYMPETKMSTFAANTNLPYVNGCSTKQIFPPDRIGDPTLQLLNIPPYSSEQAHHIHSTVRVAYIVSGTGRSIVGMQGENIVEDLFPGKVVILQKMCPHHFETDEQHLIVLPLHVFSSAGPVERSHPMFNGTHLTEIVA